MAHNVALSENPNTEAEIGRLTIAAAAKAHPTGQVNTLRVSRVRGGLRFTAAKGTHVHGEDLYALRALINEIPEELFVEPKPVDAPFWSPGDSFVWNSPDDSFPPKLYELGTDGFWYDGGKAIYPSTESNAYEAFSRLAERNVRAGRPDYIVIRRKNA